VSAAAVSTGAGARIVGEQHRELDLRVDLHALPQLPIVRPQPFEHFVETENGGVARLVGALVCRMLVNDALVCGHRARRFAGFGVDLAEQEQVVGHARIGRERCHELFVVVGGFQVVARSVALLCLAVRQLGQLAEVFLESRQVVGALGVAVQGPEAAAHAVTRHEVFFPGADFAREIGRDQRVDHALVEYRRASIEAVVDDERFERGDAVEIPLFRLQIVRQPLIHTMLPHRLVQLIHVVGERFRSIQI
jgi:hypothetical protein